MQQILGKYVACLIYIKVVVYKIVGVTLDFINKVGCHTCLVSTK